VATSRRNPVDIFLPHRHRCFHRASVHRLSDVLWRGQRATYKPPASPLPLKLLGERAS
jgi:hypothetical protein